MFMAPHGGQFGAATAVYARPAAVAAPLLLAGGGVAAAVAPTTTANAGGALDALKKHTSALGCHRPWVHEGTCVCARGTVGRQCDDADSKPCTAQTWRMALNNPHSPHARSPPPPSLPPNPTAKMAEDQAKKADQLAHYVSSAPFQGAEGLRGVLCDAMHGDTAHAGAHAALHTQHAPSAIPPSLFAR